MKLSRAEIEIAVGEGDWAGVLGAFSRHFGVPAIRDITPRPSIYKRSQVSLYLPFGGTPRNIAAIVYIRCGGREYRSDFMGIYDLDTVPGAPDSFVVVQLVNEHEARQ